MDALQQIKKLLSLNDDLQDEQIMIIINSVESRLKLLVREAVVPPAL